MKTTLDGADCLTSEIKLINQHDERVGLKFKRKVLDVLADRRDLLKQRSQRPFEPNHRRQVGRLLASNGRLERVGAAVAGRTAAEQAKQHEQVRPTDASSQPEERAPASAMGLKRQPPSEPLDQMTRPAEEPNERRPVGKIQAVSKQELYQFQMSSPPSKVLPNNTLVEDLCKCHDNLLPKVTRATAKTVELFKSCSPSWLGRRAAREKSQISGYVNKNIVLSEDEHADQLGSQANAAVSNERINNLASLTPQINRPNRTRRKLKFQEPETILGLNTSLKPDDYNRALCILTNDVRYQLHLLLYRRLQTIWTLFSTILCILVPILFFVTLEPVAIGCACFVWLSLQTLGALVTRQFCSKLDQMLERAVAQVNSYFMDHNLMLGVINVGGLFTRARLVIPLLYFDTSQCREHIESILSADLRKQSDADVPGDKANTVQPNPKWREAKRERQFALNYSKIGLHKIGPASQMSFAQSQLAKKIVLRYSQRWISFYDKQKLMFADDTAKPRHLSTGKCLCQFIEEHFKYADLSEPDQLGPDQAGQMAAPPAGNHVIETSDNHKLAAEMRADQQRQLAATILQMPERDEFDSMGELIESRKSSPLGSILYNHSGAQVSPDLSLQQQLDLLVPTLSQLVSSRERQEQLKINIEQSNSAELGSFLGGKLAHNLASHLQHERLESNSSPTTEHSLDLTEASDTTLGSARNDELIKRLKLLLDSRKDEFARGLDGQTGANQTSPTRLTTKTSEKSLGDDTRQVSQSGSSQTINLQDETNNESNNNNNNNNNNSSSPISQLGKRFFSQTDGIFFLGNKKSQQGVYGKQQRQTLEIC